MNSVCVNMAVVIGIIAALILWRREMRWIEVVHYRIPMGEDFPDDPVILIHLTDMHIAPWSKPSDLSGVIDWANGKNPDYVVLTGDYVTHFKEFIPGCCKVLSRLNPKRKTLAVLGNHDYWVNSQYVSNGLTEAGIELLKNRGFREDTNKGPVFIGVEDPFTGHDNLDKAMKGLPGEGVRVLLAHTPDIIEKAKKKKIDLVLTGHTHGGQVCIPFFGAFYVPSEFGTRYASGWFKEGNTRMFVNRGIGEVYPPVRFLCRREAAVLELVKGTGEVETVSKEFIPLGSAKCKPQGQQ